MVVPPMLVFLFIYFLIYSFTFKLKIMNAQTFLRQTVINPETAEETERLAVRFDNGKVLRMFLPKDSGTLEEVLATIKANKEAAIKKVNVKEGEYGEYCMLSSAVTLEEV